MIVPGSGCMFSALGATGWVTELGGTADASLLSGCMPQGDNVIAIGHSHYADDSTGDVLALAFKKLDGSIVWQEKVDTVASQKIRYGGPAIGPAGKIRYPRWNWVGGSINLEVDSLNSDGTLSGAGRITTTGWRVANTTPGIDASDNLYVPCGDTSGNMGVYKFDSSDAFVVAKRTDKPGNFSALKCSGNNVIFAQDDLGTQGQFLMSITNDLATVNWAIRTTVLSGADVPYPYSIDVDGSGNIYFNGGRIALTSGGLSELHKFDPSGSLLWAKKPSGTNNAIGGVVVTPNGVAWAVGDGAISGKASCAIVVLDPSGAVIWGMQFGRAGLDIAFTGIQVDADSLYVTGYAGISSNIPFIMKVPFASPIPAGTYGNWTVAAFSGLTNATPTVTGASVTLSAPTAAGASATPTLTTTSLTPTTTVL